MMVNRGNAVRFVQDELDNRENPYGELAAFIRKICTNNRAFVILLRKRTTNYMCQIGIWIPYCDP
jgi:hypothetical protein